MEFDQLIRQLERRLKDPLPGKDAHLKMSPQPVDMRRFEPVLPENHRKSGVLILFYPGEMGSFFPLIKRPEYPGFHSGQVAFPGGKMEEGDLNIIQTALREAEEEVGINRREVQILGKLSDLYIPTSNFLVSPVIGFLEKRPDLIPEEKEVFRIIQTNLQFLLKPEVRKQKVLEFGPALKLDTPYFEIDGEVVWGATAMILSELIQILDLGQE
ncbi:CoA pyrophosphatase [Algoriphagus sp. A40]|uniref:NUDIX hydrolase n=1 Tax=Algoriphagus sp. A40 TaxID=1945863 RepID=UPI000987B3B5|nr:CoA pyrophosphatase [Algoriphagus sp. A40]OOG72787.1 coenzyme A pyrophosphatase [Algoriphagus sp. A40]